MSTHYPGEPCLTQLDHGRLAALNSKRQSAELADLLDAADITRSTDVRPDVITLYSQVMVSEHEGGAQRKLTLCYPHDAEPHNGFISVLSPVGLALLGRCVGSEVTWTTPSGERRLLTIEAVLFQPESTGDYTT